MYDCQQKQLSPEGWEQQQYAHNAARLPLDNARHGNNHELISRYTSCTDSDTVVVPDPVTAHLLHDDETYLT